MNTSFYSCVYGAAGLLLCAASLGGCGGGDGSLDIEGGSATVTGANASGAASGAGGSGGAAMMSATGSGGASSAGPSATAATSSSASGGPTCTGFGDACTGCISKACPSTFCACKGDPACLDLFSCTGACDQDKACQQACLAKDEAGISEFFLVLDCAGSDCPVECPGNKPAEPCGKCVFETCSDVMNACLSASACLSLFQCLNACAPNDLACNQACYGMYGDGVPALQKVLDCAKASCPNVCK